MINSNMIELIVLIVTMGSFLVALAILMSVYNSNRGSRYDPNSKRVDLDSMRESIENRMFDMNRRLVATEDRWIDANHLLISSQNLQPSEASVTSPTTMSSFLSSAGVNQSDLSVQDDLVFVLTPFSSRHQLEFDNIALACRDMGLIARRGDETFIQGDIFPYIVKMIVKSKIIIANINGRNPNVFYELGIAQALGKTTIIVSETPDDVPFDLRTKRLVLYSNMNNLREGIKSEIARIISHRNFM